MLMNFLIFLAACAAAAATGAVFKPGEWYDTLQKPGFTPPGWVFPVAWTALYVLIAVAAARVARLPGAGPVIGLWAVQIALNTLWTPMFFGAHAIGGALIVLTSLWAAVALTTVGFWRLDTWAGVMFLPYLAWLSYAWALNFAIWRMNPAGG